MCGSSATASAGVCLFLRILERLGICGLPAKGKGCLPPWLLTPHEAGAVPLASAASHHPCRWGRTSPIESLPASLSMDLADCASTFPTPTLWPFVSRAPGLLLNIKGVVNPLRFFRLFLLKIRGHKPRKEQGQVLSDCSV